jgi:hypothetical protein
MSGFCMVEHCDRLNYSRGWCKRHYMQILRHGHLTLDSERGVVSDCKASGCKLTADVKGYCRKHARQIKIYGELREDREYMTGKKICSEKDCDSKVRARGLCAKHYTRRRRSNSLP